MAWFFKFFLWCHRSIYRLTDGRWGGQMMGSPILLLTTTGRKTGKQRTIPIAYVRDDEGHYVITGTNGGRAVHPAWWHNLQANPHASIQVLGQHLPIVASETPSPQREELYAKFEAMQAGYSRYKSMSERRIPVVILRPQSS
jgi:deazaflavin-dependent oxidoreductase (nitroreductase family)